MISVFVTNDGVSVEASPDPSIADGMVLVDTAFSLISTGTEQALLSGATTTLWHRIRSDPMLLAKGARRVLEKGISAVSDYRRRSEAAVGAPGYSASGTVSAVGPGVEGVSVGDRVACAGAGYARHASKIAVPANLTVVVPENVTLRHAASVAVGAIALHGVRRAELEIGECAVVIGLGLLGNIASQIAAASGCRVIGLDTDAVRAARMASRCETIAASDPDRLRSLVLDATDGFGADAVLVCAASASHEIISLAFSLSRSKGRVVVIGDVGLNLRREDFYAREIDFRIATSYGPGRYQRTFEEEGLDFPIGYVRWTERRNMGEYLRLVSERRIVLDDVLERDFPVAEARRAYEALSSEVAPRPLGVTLSYGAAAPVADARRDSPRRVLAHRSGRVRLLIQGAGDFVKYMHAPNLLGLKDKVEVVGVFTGDTVAGYQVGRMLGAPHLGARASAVDFEGVDAILIANRHDRHAESVCAALEHGLSVYCEKPLCLTFDELERIAALIQARSEHPPVVVTGFNRPWSPGVQALKGELSTRRGAATVLYRINAGQLPREHWTLGAEGGGRLLGEGCHFIHCVSNLLGSGARVLSAASVARADAFAMAGESFQVTLGFPDGSIGSIHYTALGGSAMPKERLEVAAGGISWVLDDFRRVSRFGKTDKEIWTGAQDKGHKALLESFIDAVAGAAPAAMTWSEQYEAMRLTIEARQLTETA